MPELDSQTAYWDKAAATGTKRFAHPLHMPWLNNVSRDAAILDYGCGYGRIMNDLAQQGFNNLSGVDASPGMIARARQLHPTMQFAVLDEPPTLACADASVDVILLFAVLTCIPDDRAQRRLISELSRVLKPGGLLYVSDLLLQDDQRNCDRYAEFAERYGTYGVFRTDDGAVCRHHPREWFTALLAGFDSIDTRRITVATMNGHEAEGIQILTRS
ncbi:class I SAM-dependent methyltransferase [Streptomyces sp. HC44]|uniref:Class I SAM-dependent methyltransferase n=2 Tax=Streptomyces scabichelini TaxID=2711217 RepID=A0A6G4VCC1_9ACTN|nr:class I SAM-dependent methyltransferase [Streptomyces scabichelini]